MWSRVGRAVLAGLTAAALAACSSGSPPTWQDAAPTGAPATSAPPTPTPPARAAAGPRPGAACPGDARHGEAVRFGTGGARLGGIAFGHASNAAVVLVPDATGDLCAWARYARALAKRRYLVLAFDLPGRGASAGPSGDYDKAVAAAVAYVRGRGGAKVVLVGAGVGGTAA